MGWEERELRSSELGDWGSRSRGRRGRLGGGGTRGGGEKLGDAWRGELGFLVEAFAEAAAAIGGEKGNGAEQRTGGGGRGWFV